MEEYLTHYGTARCSGRYPWGSGEDSYQRAIGWRGHINELKKQGLSDVEIARNEGITTTQLRARSSITKAEVRANQTSEVIRMKEHGYSNTEIGRRMGINESSVRSLLDPVLAERSEITASTAKTLKESVDQQRFIDVGAGIENYVGVSRTKINTAIAELQEEGYKIHKINVPQLGMPGQFTTIKVLGSPDTEWKEIVNPADFDKIKSLNMISNDYGRTFSVDPNSGPTKNIDSSRLEVKYGDEGGRLKDGVIELRRGVEDLDLGSSKYAQVRIGVDGTHYLKGMAIYSDDLPAGVDIMFNSNKKDTGNKLDALKKMNTKIENEDGSVIYVDKNGKQKVNEFGATFKEGGKKGALNIVNEEGDWESWSKTISSQVLSKQPNSLAKQQLGLAYKEKLDEYNEIMSLTNPVIKKELLTAFSDDCDASAVHLKAAGMPRQASKVLLPIPSLKENEIYAPTFKNGETVVLIRHPHGGTFEIPQVTVNNKSKAAKAIMENAVDGIGINPKIAQKLSGADFDGDTVIVIPNNNGVFKSTSSLKSLRNFDPIEAYPGYPGMKAIKPQTKQTKMGEISNLITDMTIKGATLNEISRAVKHSMVVIDSEKHNLDYKRSYIDNGIAGLAEKYQNSKRGGASTIISRANSEYRINERKDGVYDGPISARTGKKTKIYTDPKTGKKLYTETGESYVNADGKTIVKKTKSTKMFEADDANTLSSGRPIEQIYATHANNLKALGNKARLEVLDIVPTPYSPSAKAVYKKEVESLNAKLRIAEKNKPLERQAQLMANTLVARKKQANPDLDNDDAKKVRNAALSEARTRTGAKKNMVVIEPKEWDAIQAGAVSSSKLSSIIKNANLDDVKRLATPHVSTSSMSASKVSRAKTLLNSGLTQAEVAETLGVSTSALSSALK